MMRFAFLLILTISLSGCAQKPDPVETAVGAAHEQIAAISESLPAQCKTAAIKKQLKSADTSVDVVEYACNARTDAINAEKLRWKWAFISLLIIVLANIARKVIK